eukprot:COSAG02_NODE_28477_length_588_cov_6.231441_1_plen_41_part_01
MGGVEMGRGERGEEGEGCGNVVPTPRSVRAIASPPPLGGLP